MTDIKKMMNDGGVRRMIYPLVLLIRDDVCCLPVLPRSASEDAGDRKITLLLFGARLPQ